MQTKRLQLQLIELHKYGILNARATKTLHGKTSSDTCENRGAWEGGATNAKLKQISQELDPQGSVYTAAMLTAQGGTCLAHWPCQKTLHSHTGPTKGSRNGIKRNSTDNVQSSCTDRTICNNRPRLCDCIHNKATPSSAR